MMSCNLLVKHLRLQPFGTFLHRWSNWALSTTNCLVLSCKFHESFILWSSKDYESTACKADYCDSLMVNASFSNSLKIDPPRQSQLTWNGSGGGRAATLVRISSGRGNLPCSLQQKHRLLSVIGIQVLGTRHILPSRSILCVLYLIAWRWDPALQPHGVGLIPVPGGYPWWKLSTCVSPFSLFSYQSPSPLSLCLKSLAEPPLSALKRR